MRRPSVRLQQDRRAEILEAARRCFARMGFHQTSMQQICIEAGMSPGNLYRYFPSKEAVIAGIAERDRAEVAAELAVAEHAADLFATLEALAQRHLVERPIDDVGLCAEMIAESRRNPTMARIMCDFDAELRSRLLAMLRAARERGEIAPAADLEETVTAMILFADGVWRRRAVHPDFDAAASVPLFMRLVRFLLGKNENEDQSRPRPAPVETIP